MEGGPGIRPLGLVFIVTMCTLTLTLKRRKALLPLLITVCYMPLGQEFIIAGLNFQFLRILLLVGLCRVLAQGETAGWRSTLLDRLFVWWAASTVVIGTLAEPAPARFINLAGEVFNALGIYFLFRCWVRDADEVTDTLRFLGWMILPLAVSMLVEKSTSRNIFSMFGGVPEITAVREGKLRCQGAFRHPILAGTYAATLFPLFIGLWFQGKQSRWPSAVGSCSSLVATVCAASSGALLAIGSAIMGLALWRARRYMRALRWATVFTVIALHMVMKAPVWYLIARASDIVGGTGWHRSYLIDQAVKHFGEWWLAGSTYTAHWAPSGQVLAVDPRNMDITNQYIQEGLDGGIIKLGLFIAIIAEGFRTVGRWMHRKPCLPFPSGIFIWSLGVCLMAHCVSFLSVTYFDQIVVMWYWLLAVLSMLAAKRVFRNREQTTLASSSGDQSPPSPSVQDQPEPDGTNPLSGTHFTGKWQMWPGSKVGLTSVRAPFLIYC